MRHRRHEGDSTRDVLRNAFELVDRHQQVVQGDLTNRQCVVVELETGDRGVEKVAVQVVIQLIGRIEACAIDRHEPGGALFQILGPRIDRRLRIVGPTRVLARISECRGGFRVLRHPVLPVVVELRAQQVGPALRRLHGAGNRRTNERQHAQQRVKTHGLVTSNRRW